MKRIILSVLTMPALLCGCQKDHVSELAQGRGTIQATIEEISSTRTVMDEDNNIRWSEGDQIVGFMKSTLGVKYQVTAASVGKTSASFEEVSSGGLNAGTELEHIIAYYPYSSSVSAAKSGSNYTLDVVLPTEQTYVAESFGNGAMPMVAVSETNNITFRNVCGGMKLQLKGTQKVASIKVEGKNGELLSGAATVTAYTDETKPAITMASDASTSVTLNCGSGVQLNESTATEFILAMPPVLFSMGFTVTVTDSDSQTYTIETAKANTVFRSSLLVMPIAQLNTSGGEDSGDNEELIIPVSSLSISKSSIVLAPNTSFTLLAQVAPIDASDKTVIWHSDDYSIVDVDQSGKVIARSEGVAVISAVAGGITEACKVKVISCATPTIDYIDEYDVNHGKGIAIADIIWAPVNCGYNSDMYPYGKLYQWGRKYGQGLGSPYDSAVVEIGDGPVSITSGQNKENENVFFRGNSDFGNNWLSPASYDLWNVGTIQEPLKSEFDPCPAGWRVPTSTELSSLAANWEYTNMIGHWFSGPYTYSEEAPQIFVTASGCRTSNGYVLDVEGSYGGCYYWASGYNSRMYIYYAVTTYPRPYYDCPASAFAVRCVQE